MTSCLRTRVSVQATFGGVTPREILATEKVAKSLEQPPRMVPITPPIRSLSKFEYPEGKSTGCTWIAEDRGSQESIHGLSERSNSLYNLLLGRTTMQKMGIVVSTIHAAIKFHTPCGIGTVFSTYEPNKVEEGQKKVKETVPETYADMTGILITIMVGGKPFNTEHKLNEYKHIEPVKQKKRGLAPERNEAACKEVDELTKAGILWEVKYQTWVANPVMVKKSDGGWRMCVDFTDINKARSKDCYPLQEINSKVESLSGVLSYRKMPFSLKNARATYQRLVNKVFNDQIRRNLKAYVDDMVIKSASEEDMLMDIQETFDRLRSINMKLNPKKCSFGVEEGPFLGHLIT
ncbi:reverse transcriptase domain-containing protein, partial [Tanacetum coccineum]